MNDPPTIMCLDSAGKPASTVDYAVGAGLPALFQPDCYDDLAQLRTPPSVRGQKQRDSEPQRRGSEAQRRGSEVQP